MTTHPDVTGAVLALDQAMIALAVARSTLLGETSSPLDLAAAEASPANPYGSYVSPYTAPSAAAVTQDVEPDRCPRCESPSPNLHPAMQYEGEVQPCPDPWHLPTGHLPQHSHGEPGCTYGGCTDHAHDAGVTR